MRKRIERFIPQALKLAEKHIAKDNVIPKVFNGYISSFGAAIIQSGLLPAIAFYSEKGTAEEDRTKIIKVIWCIISNEKYDDIENKVNGNYISNKIIEQSKKDDNLKEKIIDAAVALKLAIRTFDLKDN